MNNPGMSETADARDMTPSRETGLKDPAGAGLETCPACDYELAGLGTKGRCPECGLEYDEHSRVWRPRPRLPLIRGVIIFGIVLPVCVNHTFGDELRPVLGGLLWPLAGAWFVLVLGFVLRMRFMHRHRYLAAVLPNGLLVRHDQSELIPWSDITALEVTLPEVRIFRARGRCVGLAFLFANRLEKEAFVARVSEARARVGASALNQPPTWSARRLFHAALRW